MSFPPYKQKSPSSNFIWELESIDYIISGSKNPHHLSNGFGFRVQKLLGIDVLKVVDRCLDIQVRKTSYLKENTLLLFIVEFFEEVWEFIDGEIPVALHSRAQEADISGNIPINFSIYT